MNGWSAFWILIAFLVGAVMNVDGQKEVYAEKGFFRLDGVVYTVTKKGTP